MIGSVPNKQNPQMDFPIDFSKSYDTADEMTHHGM